MDKLDMQSKNLVDENIEKIAKLFPNCITEGKNENGKLTRLIDFDLLKQELSKDIVEGTDERYTLNWAGKKQAILTANSPINATLRPCREESVDFDNTKNLYIEGDNLDVLKLLRETYLGKVKMIYIDPPYNTGNDFVYEDDFATSANEYLQNSKSYDEQGNRMFQNNDSNGRFHSDWLSMMYSRLKLAKDLLTDDGAIFISIDDCEFKNLLNVCNEIFGEKNFIANLIWKSKSGGANDSRFFAVDHEYVVVYAKNADSLTILQDKEATVTTSYNRKDENGEYALDRLDKQSIRYSKALDYEIVGPDGQIYTPKHKDANNPNATWRWSKDNVEKNKHLLVFENGCVYTKNYKKEGAIARSLLLEDRFGRTRTGKTDVFSLFNINLFSSPKPYKLIRFLEMIVTDKDSIVMDFFSGSATTAHSTMQLNAEDLGKRQFILVQLPENCNEDSEEYKAGYKNICEIGKERIRRAGKKIKEENIDCNVDTGFRVLKLDSSNMKDIYYKPAELNQASLLDYVSNIKEDRTPEDLLFQVMLDMGVMLSSEIKTIDIKGKKVFNVNDGNLVCCFDNDLTDEVVTEIAKLQPLYAVFRDASMSSDSVAVNFDQIFETYSPTTTRKVL
ncbi:MAG: site-specific DNA-methyltransferase [Eubacteriales bacterium]|nr:site-specific DNA-methyltransferase [Eubacteriales bacterium]